MNNRPIVPFILRITPKKLKNEINVRVPLSKPLRMFKTRTSTLLIKNQNSQKAQVWQTPLSVKLVCTAPTLPHASKGCQKSKQSKGVILILTYNH